MSLIKISELTATTVANDSMVFPIVTGGTTKKILGQDVKSYMVDYSITNQFYIDPHRTDDYTPTGNPNKPYKDIATCYAAIKALITANTIDSGATNPIYMILCGSVTLPSDLTLDTGHIFLVGAQGGIHAPILLNGNIIINPTSGTLNDNHFSLSNLQVNGTSGQNAIKVTGSTPCRVFLQDMWIVANASGEVGTGFYQDNTGTGTITNGDSIKIAQNGTGDVYCFQITKGTAYFSDVETSGATQIGAVGSGASLSFTNSELDANGEVCLEVYGTGVLAVANSTITNANTSTDAYGVWLHAAGGAALITNTVIDVASSATNSRMIKGVAGTGVFYKNLMVGKAITFPFADHNKKVDSTVTMSAITTDSFTVV